MIARIKGCLAATKAASNKLDEAFQRLEDNIVAALADIPLHLLFRTATRAAVVGLLTGARDRDGKGRAPDAARKLTGALMRRAPLRRQSAPTFLTTFSPKSRTCTPACALSGLPTLRQTALT
jgi:hypothetical protein